MINLFTFVAEEETAIRFAQTKLVDKDYLSFRPVLEGFWVRSIPYEETL
jgi:hypothetical protein